MKRLLFIVAIVAGLSAGAFYLWHHSIRCGLGNAENYLRITKPLERCAAKGDLEAQFWLAGLEIGDAPSGSNAEYEGFRKMRKAAEAGSADAQNEIGYAYLIGAYGVEVDEEEAARWLTKATEGGSEIAPLNLARLYLAKPVVPPERKEKAIKLLKLSAKRGYFNAECILMNLGLSDIHPGSMGYYLHGFGECAWVEVPDEFHSLHYKVLESDEASPYLDAEPLTIPFEIE